jgi:membrane-associated phospholipid phosphatase
VALSGIEPPLPDPLYQGPREAPSMRRFCQRRHFDPVTLIYFRRFRDMPGPLPFMHIAPTQFDLWCARELAGLLTHHTDLSVGVQRGIASNVLGGLWFGLALFVHWVQSARKGQSETQIRILTILFGSTLAIVFSLIAGSLFSWPPPVHYPGLEQLYVGLLEPNPNISSFPSLSVALYASVAAGIYSLRKAVGWVLWVLVAVFVAIPRMFVGGHYLTDVLVGLIFSLIGYWIARSILETRFTCRFARFLDKTTQLQLLREVVVFLWIIQVTVEFQGVTWLKNFAESLVH